MDIERISDGDGNLLAMIVRGASYETIQPGLNFITTPEDGLQVGFLNHPEGKHIEAHRHNLPTKFPPTRSEVMLVLKGTIEITMYGVEPSDAVAMRILCPGDLLVHVQGGHEFRFREDSEAFYVKQGPYTGHSDDKVLI